MSLRFLTSGESHGPALVAILDGLPAGLSVSSELINHDLARRQHGYGSGGRMQIEHDQVQILGGIMDGITTGAPLAVIIPNQDHKVWKGREIEPFTTPRPGHADLSAAIKYGYRDLRPALERASARETAARVAIGAVCRALLAQFKIVVGGYVSSIGDIVANPSEIPYIDRFKTALESDLVCPDPQAAEAMRVRINQVIAEGDTIGGIIEVVGLGIPPGLGSHVQWDRRLDAKIGAAVLSIQAIKGVEIGSAFQNTHFSGTQVHDPIHLNGNNIVRPTDQSGGLEGGITTGQELIVRAAMKPIATTLKSQRSVDLASGITASTHYERSDFCPVPRAVVIVEAMVAFVLADALLEKLGGDSVDELQQRFTKLRQSTLTDLPMDNHPHTWWPA